MLRAEAASAGPAGFRHAHPHALLVGVGIVPVTLPDPEDEGTLLLDEGQLNVDEVAQSRAIQGRVFWIKPASGEPLGSSGNLRVTLGRERHCDVVLPDFPVSGLHCWFVLNDAGALEVVDDHSTNGTFLNGSVCLPRAHKVLRNGDSLVFGRFAFEYWSSASAMLKL